jgi:uncharacterized protein (DUF1697 family)
MGTSVVLLRGINLGPTNRIAMPALREALTAAGFTDVRTYVQSGNIVLNSNVTGEALAEQIRGLIAEQFGLDIAVVTRTRDELAKVVERNPLAGVVTNPKRYQVSFLSGELGDDAVRELEALAVVSERIVVIGREAYAWHPDGIARSKLAMKLGAKGLGVTATTRNWTTVTTLLSMADA